LETTFIAYDLPENISMSFIHNERSHIFRRLIVLILFYKVRLLKQHKVVFWSDNVRSVQQLTGRQQNQNSDEIIKSFCPKVFDPQCIFQD